MDMQEIKRIELIKINEYLNNKTLKGNNIRFIRIFIQGYLEVKLEKLNK